MYICVSGNVQQLFNPGTVRIEWNQLNTENVNEDLLGISREGEDY